MTFGVAQRLFRTWEDATTESKSNVKPRMTFEVALRRFCTWGDVTTKSKPQVKAKMMTFGVALCPFLSLGTAGTGRVSVWQWH